ncbi:protein RST1 isoform X2 [Henckelia pumila]|uniref:protein RST1 isoform X2 n=1 Tax=Henckelia pumila TaxID=405737 RepID=UPI003C6DEA74
MEAYAPLLEKTRIPQPSLQRLAVISIFEKIRSAPSSSAGIDVLNLCLNSASPAVVDQSTRELCRLVKDSKFDLSTALLELHSALEGSSSPQSRCVFVKAIGFLTRFGFQEKPSSFRFHSSEIHPFVKILSCGTVVQCELVKQVVLFMLKSKHLGMEAVCEFLGPFLNYSVVKLPVMGHSSEFTRNLISTILALCCSLPQEAIPIVNLLTERLKYFSCKKPEEVVNISYVVECLVDAYLVVLRQLVGMRFLVREAQLCGLALVEAILLLHTDFRKCSGGVEKIIDASRHLLAVQKELNLNYMVEFSSVMLSLLPILMQSELEHEQYPVLKLVLFLLRWKSEREYDMNAVTSELTEELLFIFPVLALVSSPSRCIKQIASDLLSILGKMATALLIAPKKKQAGEWKQQSTTTPGHLLFKFLRNMWFEDKSSSLGLVYVTIFSSRKVLTNEEHNRLKTWSSSVREYCLGIIEKHKQSATIAHSGKSVLTEIPSLLCATASVLLLHHRGNFVIDLLDIGSSLEPKLGVPLLLAVLFYSHIFSSKDKDNDAHDMLLKLLGLLPSLASHSAMTPLVVQVLLPMLNKDVNPVIKATAIRMICKTWVINDRVFGTLHGALHQSGLTQFASERSICISMAVSILDVCKQNPDRGVDLILSVEACIENNDHLVRSLGFQSLACLCEADVIDFYTAWEVIEVHAQNYLGNALVAHGLSLLLKWGAMDADAYPEAATYVLNILWNIVAYGEVSQSSLWTSAQEAAFAALLRYEVIHIQRSIPDFSSRNMELLISQANPELLTAVEEFEVKIINYEHLTRQRFVKQRKVSGNKIVKLLDVVPDVIFTSGSNHRAKELPGAALLVIPTPKDRTHQKDVHAVYEDATMEIAASLQLSRNILLALFSLQSWKPFMLRWIRSGIKVLEAKAHTVPDKTLKAADYIMKVITRLAELASPQSAENMALAMGAFCLVLPPSSHTIKSIASKFLLNWLSQYEHEHRQWSAAISLGLISSCLHVTDHKQKFENINALIEVASVSKSTLVKGACGTGLGFSCQDLLTRVNAGPNTLHEKNTFNKQETELLRKILRSLIQMICQFTGSSAHILEKLASYFPLGTDDSTPPRTVEFLREDAVSLDLEDLWGIAGPIIGLGNSFGALYRAGAHDAVRYLKNLIFSWIPSANFLSSKSAVSETGWQMPSLGACLALPSIVLFCQRVELINRIELVHLVNGFMELLSELISVELSDTFHQYLLMASCVGAGSLLSIILNAGVHSLEVESVKGLLEIFRRTYSSPHPPFIHLGGMLGVVNALGADAGILIPHYRLPSLHTTFSQKESSYVLGPLLSNLVLEQELITLIQEIFLVAQNSDDPRLKHYASWAVTFLRHSLFTEETSYEEIAVSNQSGVHESIPQGLAEDSLVMKLSLWLINVNYPELGTRINICTVSCALRCLSHAPRLPSLDWGAVIRRCMTYSDQVDEVTTRNLALRRTLREECFLFSFSHGNQSDSLLGFLDELSDLPRLKTLDSHLQSLVFLHLGALLKIFSSSRLVKLFDDLAAFILWFVSSDQYNQALKVSLRVLCWKGLCLCLNESALEVQDYAYTLEHCMEVLFEMLPWSHLTDSGLYHGNSSAEWTEAIRCLGKARQSWLSNLLMVLEANFKEENRDLRTLKKIQVKAALVRIGSVPLLELAKLKAVILDTNSEVIWNILVEVAVTLHNTQENVRRQWLVDTAEILCVTSHPSTALRFLGLLCGSCCKYMPILIGDEASVLSDLPVTLFALLSGTGWEMAAESIASYIWTSTERIHDWVTHRERADYLQIDRSENDSADVLLRVLHRTSILLKDYLPVDKQLRLANMDFTLT